MAGIDKTYVNREQLLEAIEWAKNLGEVTLENGYKFFPLDWIRGYNEIDDNGVLNNTNSSDCYVLWNTPGWFDRWLYGRVSVPDPGTFRIDPHHRPLGTS